MTHPAKCQDWQMLPTVILKKDKQILWNAISCGRNAVRVIKTRPLFHSLTMSLTMAILERLESKSNCLEAK